MMLLPSPCKLLLFLASSTLLGSARGHPHARRDDHETIGGTADNTHDYIVVGSGPGGGVVASNLALAGHSVLLIEAGRDASDDLSTSIAALSYPGTDTLKWHFFVKHFGDDEDQELQYNHLTWTLPNGSYWVGSGARAPKDARLDGVYYPRGATLGGSAIVNAMGTFLPNDADWDYVADITGDDSWSSGKMRSIFEKVEKNHYLPKGTQGHGFDGFMDTQLGSPDYYKRSPGALSFLGAFAGVLLGRIASPLGASELLPLIGRDPNFEGTGRDFATGSFGLPIHTTGFGKRWSPRDFILSTFNAKNKDGSARYRLKLQLESLATRILFDHDRASSKPRAVGVEFLEGSMVYGASWKHDSANPPPKGTRKRAYARKEVIVSGGTFNSPQLLQLSGLGDRPHLRSLNIPVVAHIPGVGRNLHDNQELPVAGQGAAAFAAGPDPAAAHNCTHGAPGDPCVAAWWEGAGPYADAAAQGNSECALLRTEHSPDGRRDVLTFSPPGPAFRGFWPPTDQTDPGLFTDPPSAVSRSIVRMSPRPPSGKAEVLIASADPTAPPAINFEHFPGGLDDEDIGAMLDTVAFVRRVFAAVPPPYGPDADWVRSQAFGHHAAGTCRIGNFSHEEEGNEDGPGLGNDDPLAVLDARFRVRGVRGLRVVDASVFPRQPGAFPVLATVMVGQKASEADTHQEGQSINNDEFRRWRPKYHLIAPRGWVNDPCAPGYDPVNEVYHVGFQWVPTGVEWNNSISWGSAVSPDLVSWTVRNRTSLAPTPDADRLGVFTGCLSPVSAKPGAITAFYTSVTKSPIHHAAPYVYGQERLHAATSSDAGRTWARHEGNPVLSGPPAGLDVTGWRDPFVAPWLSMARILGDPPATLYALIAGGTRAGGPTSFLYRLAPEALYDWTFLSTLGAMPKRLSASGDRYDFGANWEVANFVSFPDPDSPAAADAQLDFLLMSAEGMTVETTGGGGVPPSGQHAGFRRDHKQMWLCGKLQQPGREQEQEKEQEQPQPVEMAYRYGGFLDHGCYYAGNSFCEPQSQRHIILGWLVEEDLPLHRRQAQGWSGMLSLPRMLKLQRLENVFEPDDSKMEKLKSFGVHQTAPQTYTLTTLCAVPAGRLQQLRRNHQSLAPQTLLPNASTGGLGLPHGDCWELKASFELTPETESVGLVLQHAKDDPSIRTIITFRPSNETLTITRHHSTPHNDVNTSEETAPHTLFEFLGPSTTASGGDGSSTAPAARTEPLTLRIFFDVSALEVFANERTAISTRIYPDSGACYGISPFVEEGECKMLQCDYWEMAPNVHVAED
ncbi:GMC oxidoreductase-like protein [Apiospora aurea]|uniref:GMC oxidoreductase-like protein n=1 Tax=Apiospora aurea TaxID=335848 RepID=A0ABR1QMD4_9PEZI